MFRIKYTEDRRPDRKCIFNFKDPEYARRRVEQLSSQSSFQVIASTAPKTCPFCQTSASEYSATHNNAVLFEPTASGFKCVVCDYEL